MTVRSPSLQPVPTTATPPFGTSFLPDPGVGIDLAPRGFVEEEFLLSGSADRWAISATPGHPDRLETGIPYTTRMLVRRPVDRERATGTVHLEPLHPHRDGGLTWRAAAEHIVRSGDAWVGVTVYAHLADLLRDRVDPARYSALDLPAAGLEWDILGGAAEAIRAGAIPGLDARRVLLSGWSATGSFVRVFLREGFAARRPGAIDGAIVFISSGGAGDAGYPALSPGTSGLPRLDPRRTIEGVGVPVFEVLSETESETHERQTRPDSDEDGDRYRLSQVAGTGHHDLWADGVLTNDAMLAAAGVPSPDATVLEERSDARFDLVARAALERMAAWLADGVAPPSSGRFGFTGPEGEDGRELARDDDGNVLGGIRTPWVEAPLAAYAPHGTPRPEPDGTVSEGQRFGARLLGTMRRFPPAVVLERFADEAAYRAAFLAATERLERSGFLLPADAAELVASIPERWHAAVAGSSQAG